MLVCKILVVELLAWTWNGNKICKLNTCERKLVNMCVKVVAAASCQECLTVGTMIECCAVLWLWLWAWDCMWAGAYMLHCSVHCCCLLCMCAAVFSPRDALFTESTFRFTTNEIPTTGDCDISPTYGYAYTTAFNITCTPFIDKHQPLTYVFSAGKCSTLSEYWVTQSLSLYSLFSCNDNDNNNNNNQDDMYWAVIIIKAIVRVHLMIVGQCQVAPPNTELS